MTPFTAVFLFALANPLPLPPAKPEPEFHWFLNQQETQAFLNGGPPPRWQWTGEAWELRSPKAGAP